MNKIELIPIRDLFTDQKHVTETTVNKYEKMILSWKDCGVVNVSVCHISGNKYLMNGNHRCTAKLRTWVDAILANIEPCSVTNCASPNDYCADLSELFHQVYTNPNHLKKRKIKK